MPVVERGGHRLHYEAFGDAAKPPVLLIMGLAVSSRAWDRLPQLLGRDFHVVAFDNRGTGRSGRAGFAYRMADLADDAAAVLPASRPASAPLFGTSMGGMVGQELALRPPGGRRPLALGWTLP